jgi:hypothetical protein
MNIDQRAQIVVILAVLLVVFLLIFAFLLDGSRLMIQKQKIFRAADSAGKAGLLIVADKMVTQIASASQQTPASSGTPPITGTGTPEPNSQLTLLSEDCRRTLVADPMRTEVAGQVLEVIESNEMDRFSTGDDSLEILFPADDRLDGEYLEIIVRVKKNVDLLFSQVWEIDRGVINVESRQRIPWR